MIENPMPVTGSEQNVTGQTMMNQIQPIGFIPDMYGAQGIMPGIREISSQEIISYCEDPMKELSLSTGALIRQDIENFEVVSNFEAKKKYEVLLQSEMGLKMAFKCFISTGHCCRGLKITIMHKASPEEIVPELCKIFLIAEKSYCGGCLCFCRPFLNIKLEKNQKNIGRIREPFTCCGKDYELHDDNGNVIYEVIDTEIMKDNKQAGFIEKGMMSFGVNFPKIITYKINFPGDATPEQRILLICSALLMANEN